MEIYTSESSDSDNQSSEKTLDFSYLMLDTNTLSKNFDHIVINEKHTSRDTETLLLHNNQLEMLPLNINIFSNLKVLDISSNGLTHLPEALAQCPLTALVAKNNVLENESFPKSFSSLKTLKELNLSGNSLTFFPRQILELAALKYLYLGGNKICDIPKEIWKIRGLQILYMGGNRLMEVPTSLGQLTNLHALVLSDNMLESLPAAIANLRNLKSLLLHKNRLRTLPPEIVGLKCLAELSLRDNPLVVQFVSTMQLNPSSLLEHAGRVIKLHNIPYCPEDLPLNLVEYLDSAHHCVNPKCQGHTDTDSSYGDDRKGKG
ncbi:leucine-rich repeat-containing protein 58 isoform X2 [Anabrus simplex]|uniref:leucine-rich repeat-containing protein 58 isoform X2 n=1 Tax=Anabrus simplex TaxID=316456 RepID=UPI0035A2A2B2